MKRNDITSSIKARISTLGMVTVYPNVTPPSPLTRPYLDVSFPTADRSDRTLAGTQTQERGTIAVSVVVDEGTATEAANGYADAVSDLFPTALRFAFTGGEITIMKPADIKGGFNAGTEWRVPVMIEYHANQT